MVPPSYMCCFLNPVNTIVISSINHSYHQYYLVGSLERFLFSRILGIVIPTDFHIFRRGRAQPPTRYQMELVDINHLLSTMNGYYHTLTSRKTTRIHGSAQDIVPSHLDKCLDSGNWSMKRTKRQPWRLYRYVFRLIYVIQIYGMRLWDYHRLTIYIIQIYDDHHSTQHDTTSES